VRHYGLLANRIRQAKLACCRWLLAVSQMAGQATVPGEVLGGVAAAPRPERLCPVCGVGRLILVAVLTPGSAAACDSS